MSSESQVHEIEGIGEFRARQGTAVGELAGAAKYWSDRAKRAERVNSTVFGKGFLAGCFASGATGGAIILVLRFFFHI